MRALSLCRVGARPGQLDTKLGEGVLEIGILLQPFFGEQLASGDVTPFHRGADPLLLCRVQKSVSSTLNFMAAGSCDFSRSMMTRSAIDFCRSA